MVFVLRRVHGQPLFVIGADGSDPRQLSGTPDSMSTGSPDWSHNGKRIAFDAWQPAFGENWGQRSVWVIDADGSSPRPGPGAMPSWSPDDKQLTYCQYGPERGVWIMNADGSDHRQIDADGWGSQWSPKRNEIAYTVHAGGAGVWIHGCGQERASRVARESLPANLLGPYVVAGRRVDLLQRGPVRRRLRNCRCFRGRRAERIQGAPAKLGMPEVGNAACTMAWGGTGNQILVFMQTKTDLRGAAVCSRCHRCQAAPAVSQVPRGLGEQQHGLVAGRKESGPAGRAIAEEINEVSCHIFRWRVPR